MKIGDTTYYEQDLVVQKANNYTAMIDPEHYTAEERDLIDFGEIEPLTAFIANGESGIITNVGNSHIVIQFDNDVYVRYDKSEISQMLNLGYATSIHKSQGESIDNIIVCTPQSHIYMLNSNLIYVGLTRMKKKCFHLGAVQTINQAVVKKANLTRHTFIQDMLKTTEENN